MNFVNELIQTQLTFVSAIGDSQFLLTPFAVIVFAYLYNKNYKKEALLVLISSLSYFFSILLKFIFQKGRPNSAVDLTILDYYSFPSSHALVYTVFFGYLLYLSFKLHRIDPLIKFIVRGMCVYFLLLVGISRVFLGQHWIEDVIGGYFFGFIYLSFVIYADKTVVPTRDDAKK